MQKKILVPRRREVAVARVLGRLRRCRRQRTVGHDDFSASLTLTLGQYERDDSNPNLGDTLVRHETLV